MTRLQLLIKYIEMKNRKQTERKLIDAVDHILKTKGFPGLGVNKVAKQAGVSKILIYRYFGNFEKLLKTCVAEKDFWANHLADSPIVNSESRSLQLLVSGILRDQFNHFYNHCEMEANILTSIGSDSRITKDLSNNRKEQEGESAADGNLIDSAAYYQIVSKLLVAGTQELLLQSIQKKVSGKKVHTILQKGDLLRSMERILHTAFN